MKEPPIAFPPSLGLLTAELFAKVFTHEGMRIQISRIVAATSQLRVVLFLVGKESFATRLGLGQSGSPIL